MHEWNGGYKDFKNLFDKYVTNDNAARIYFLMALASLYGAFTYSDDGLIVAVFGWLAAAMAARHAGNCEVVMARMWEVARENPRNKR